MSQLDNNNLGESQQDYFGGGNTPSRDTRYDDIPPKTRNGVGALGWTCPKCGAVYSPLIPECTRCNGRL